MQVVRVDLLNHEKRITEETSPKSSGTNTVFNLKAVTNAIGASHSLVDLFSFSCVVEAKK